ncbi:MAG: RHS repeat-associated core domain-containing protein [Thermoanaerobaculia bacterium]
MRALLDAPALAQVPLILVSLAGRDELSAEELIGEEAECASEGGERVRRPVAGWDDTLFGNATLGADSNYNVHRWYEQPTGRYASTDPLGLAADVSLYRYSFQRPLKFADPLGLYGTNDCPYYDKRGDECGGNYYCVPAPTACNSFPKYDDPNPNLDDDFEGWARCTRKCLQDCDRDAFDDRKKCNPTPCAGMGPANPDPETDEVWDEAPSFCHKKCYVVCHVWGTWGEGEPIPGIGKH